MFNPTYRDIARALNLIDPIEAFQAAHPASRGATRRVVASAPASAPGTNNGNPATTPGR
jgi:hypothetical protein